MSPERSALITGITGQDGSYLAELLLGKGYQVHGLVRQSLTERFARIEHVRDRLTLHQGDLSDEHSLRDAVSDSDPDEIYNLAALSHVAESWSEPEPAIAVSGAGVERMLEVTRELCPQARFFQASSSEIFGSARGPRSETTPLAPLSPYGVAKCNGHQTTVEYRERHGLHASNGILFNHESERRGLEFVTRKITWHAAAIKLGLRSRLRLGSLNAERDWGYAPEYVDAMWRMLQQDEPGDYVVATGVAHSVRECAAIAFDQVGCELSDHVETDPAFCRPAEAESVVGDAQKADRVLGWRPKVGFEQMIRRMVDSDYRLLANDARRVPTAARNTDT
jgi:GDPmannose 4,6-dehydratase